MGLYLKYLKMLLKAEMAYRTSFILLSIGQFFVPFTVFIGFTMLFEKFGNIKGYSFYEMALCYSVAHFAFAFSECFIRGFDSFSSLIREGGFDRLMTRPRNLALQVLGSRFEFSRVGRIAQSLIVFVIAFSGLDVTWYWWKSLLLLLMIIGGSAVFAGIFILVSTMCFWTIQGTEIANIFTDGGRELSQFPLNIYQSAFQKFFTFVIPFGMATYYPLLVLLDRLPPKWFYVVSPIYGLLFLVPCMVIWYQGVKHYQSCGS